MGGGNPDDVFDVRRVRRLVELMQEFELAEIDLRQAEQRIRLRKDVEPVIVQGGHPGMHAPPSAQAPPATAASTGAPAGPPPESANFQYITSPMVGTFYTASSPDSSPFVKIGDQVGPDTVVCIVEAMKVMNEIKAERSGEIVEILAENGQAVEFDQPLFRVKVE